jgi:hypothetical protein
MLLPPNGIDSKVRYSLGEGLKPEISGGGRRSLRVLLWLDNAIWLRSLDSHRRRHAGYMVWRSRWSFSKKFIAKLSLKEDRRGAESLNLLGLTSPRDFFSGSMDAK